MFCEKPTFSKRDELVHMETVQLCEDITLPPFLSTDSAVLTLWYSVGESFGLTDNALHCTAFTERGAFLCQTAQHGEILLILSLFPFCCYQFVVTKGVGYGPVIVPGCQDPRGVLPIRQQQHVHQLIPVTEYRFFMAHSELLLCISAHIPIFK